MLKRDVKHCPFTTIYMGLPSGWGGTIYGAFY
jgi:hypothetical protein